MTTRALKHLFDIQRACDRIADHVRATLTFSAYEADLKTRDAVERQLGIVGEAVNQYRREHDSPPLTDAAAIVQLRNLLIHAYDSVDQPQIWQLVQRHVPLLRLEVARLLAAETDGGAALPPLPGR